MSISNKEDSFHYQSSTSKSIINRFSLIDSKKDQKFLFERIYNHVVGLIEAK